MDQEKRFQTQYNDEEINLVDYIRVILKRKWLILAICLGSAIVVGILSFLAPKVYKIETVLEVSTIGGEAIELPGQAIEEINGSIYRDSIKTRLNIPDLKFPKIKPTNPTGTNLLKIEAESSDPQTAKKILEEMIDLVLRDQKEKIKDKKEVLEKNIELSENNIEILKRNIERAQSKIGILEIEKKYLEEKERALEQLLPYERINEELSGSLFLLLDTKEKISKKEIEIQNSYSKKDSLEVEINSRNGQINLSRDEINDIQAPKIAKPPITSKNPIRPRPLLNVVIAVVLGFFMGVFLALVKEWWQKEDIKT